MHFAVVNVRGCRNEDRSATDSPLRSQGREILRPGPQTRIYVEDAFVFFEQTSRSYDVIYMDAFLQTAANGWDSALDDAWKALTRHAELEIILKP